ncbi:MAG: pitrilysin family protein [Pseudomonadota bacterium]
MTRWMTAAAVWLASLTALHAAEVSNFTLDNGLEVVVLEDRRAPVVVHMLWYRVGSSDEPRGLSGVAHYLEHLMFKGTETVPDGEFSRIVAANGGRDNAFTSYDFTGYFQRVASDRLDVMMEMEADRMVNLIIDPVTMETEREVILEERNQRTENEPGSLFSEQRQAAQYLNHPYGLPIVGWRHEIEAITPEDLRAFYEAHYAPNNAILIVAGDVGPDEVRELAEQYYGVIPANPAITPRDRVDEPPQLAERRLRFEDARVSQPYVVRTYLAPERDPGDQEAAAALTLLAEVLGGDSATSVLGQTLQFEEGSAIYTSAFYSGMSLDDTTFGLVAVPAPGVSLQEVEDAMDARLASFVEDGVDAEQLERIKTQLRASLIYGEDDLGSLARRYGTALTSGLTVEDVQAWPDLLAAVTEEDILDAAQLLFQRNRAVTGWMMGPAQADTAEVIQ